MPRQRYRFAGAARIQERKDEVHKGRLRLHVRHLVGALDDGPLHRETAREDRLLRKRSEVDILRGAHLHTSSQHGPTFILGRGSMREEIAAPVSSPGSLFSPSPSVPPALALRQPSG